MIGIVCDATSIWTLGPVILETWANDMPYDFCFFVGKESTSIPAALEPYTVKLSVSEGYPLRKKVFTIF